MGRVAAARELLVVRSAATDPLITSSAIRACGVRALCGVPLLQDGEVLGVTLVGARTPFDFAEDDRKLFRSLSDRAAALLRQLQLTQREREAQVRAEVAQRRHRDLLEGIDAGISWEADALTYHVTSVSPRAETMLGYPLLQWLAAPDFWAQHLHPQDREQVLAMFGQVRPGEGPRTCEHRMIAQDGRELWGPEPPSPCGCRAADVRRPRLTPSGCRQTGPAPWPAPPR